MQPQVLTRYLTEKYNMIFKAISNMINQQNITFAEIYWRYYDFRKKIGDRTSGL